ncbi:tRNA lysidine(34) synthetase TilS [Sphingomonas sp. CGMCC 1.13654]|uniref:tRNA(Ile)-lysidine synthase n=2 Tax=Sphingomonas chungangi TaxID=2683589 RepID=A0A838L094_9SPHN|nr:tRNA lysidine(34) synthetase TilS [Sphingomonas chungangi]MVW56383.1 tRNA lysidine(34) synthetase TilS [Sphingomonas chungangi]
MPSAAPDPALLDRFERDLGRLISPDPPPSEGEFRTGIALSGGPDSLALLLLAAAIGPVKAMTVDHGLRADSASEAETAGAAARWLGVPHEIMKVSVRDGGDGLQGEARRARYAALGDWARREGLAAILTAHHADDQAETMLMRLSRGAGLSGLTGIRPVRPLDETDPSGPLLVRPLLGWRKVELEAIVTVAGIEPARDPSNYSDRFDRTAARALLAATPWLDPIRFSSSAGHLRDADEALEALTGRFLIDALSVTEVGVELTPGGAPREIVRRGLRRMFSGHFDAHPDGPGLDRLMATLAAGGTGMLGPVLAKGGPIWTFRAAPPRRSV